MDVLKFIDKNRFLFIQTNYGREFVDYLCRVLEKSLVLIQKTAPYSPILEFVIGNFSEELKIPSVVSNDIYRYFISLVKGENVSPIDLFDEYFEFNELVSRRNELFILISSYFSEILRQKTIKNVVILLKDPISFTSSAFMIEVLAKFIGNEVKLILVEDVGSSKTGSVYELFERRRIKFRLHQFFDINRLVQKERKIKMKLSIQYFDNLFRWMAWESSSVVGEDLIRLNSRLKREPKFIQEMVYSLVGARKIDDAIDLLVEFLDELKEGSDYTLLSRFYRLLGYLYAISPSRWDFTFLASLKSYEFAKKSGNSREEILSKALLFFIGHIYGKEAVDLFEFVRTNKDSFSKLYRHITSFYYFFITAREFLPYNKFISIAHDSEKYFKKNKDFFHLSLVYHFIANVLIEIGDIDNAILFDKKSARIAKSLFLPNISHIYNSLSHINYTSGNFEQSYRYSFKALKESLRELDVKEVCMTLVNIAYIYMIVNDFSNASDVMNILLKVKDEANFKRLPIHSDVKLWVMDIYIKKKLGESSIFAKNLLSLELEDVIKEGYESLGFYYWGLSMLFDNIEKKISFLKKSLEFITKDGFKYVEVKILKDLLDILIYTGNKDEAENVKREFLEKRRRYKWYEELLSSDDLIVKLPHLKLPYNLLIEEARNQYQFALIQSKKKDANFLLKVQEVLLAEFNEKELIKKIVRLISNSFLVSNVIFWNKSKDFFISSEYFEERVKDWIKQIDIREPVYTVSGSKSYFPCYSIIPVVFSDREVYGYLVLLSYNESSFISYDNFNFIKIAVSFLSTKLEAIRYVKKIEEVAKIDFLTGLYNRIEIENFLVKEMEKCKRNPNYNFSLVMIDLDNFKYYNDNFGHLVGDLILKEFSSRLSKVVRKYDFVGRFGGDEFVVVMPHTSLDKVKQAVKRWYKIFDDKFYLSIISLYKGEKIKIPENKQLSMSTGICDAALASYDVVRMLGIADENLYYNKNTKKLKTT